MKRVLSLLALLILAVNAFSQDFDLPCANLDYKESVRTVLLYADGNQNKEPLIPLDRLTQRLTLSFDIFGDEADVLNYTFIHCTNNWYISIRSMGSSRRRKNF